MALWRSRSTASARSASSGLTIPLATKGSSGCGHLRAAPRRAALRVRPGACAAGRLRSRLLGDASERAAARQPDCSSSSEAAAASVPGLLDLVAALGLLDLAGSCHLRQPGRHGVALTVETLGEFVRSASGVLGEVVDDGTVDLVVHVVGCGLRLVDGVVDAALDLALVLLACALALEVAITRQYPDGLLYASADLVCVLAHVGLLRWLVGVVADPATTTHQ